MELSEMNDKLYPKIETLDTLISMIPNRIKKEPLDY